MTAKRPSKKTIAAFLRERGWKKYMGTWWFKPLPGWNGKPAMNQEIFCQSKAYEIERMTVIVG